MEFIKLSQFLLLFVILAEITKNVNAERILVVAFVSTKSHKLTYMPLIKELGKRGHNITVVTPIKASKKMENVHEVLTYDSEKESETFMQDPFKRKAEGKRDNPFDRADFIVKVCRDTYDLPHVQVLMKEKFDLVFIQPLLNECSLGWVYRTGVPVVLFSPVSVPNFLAMHFGAHFPYSFVPHVFIPLTPEMNFLQRMQNVAINFVVMFSYLLYYEMPVTQVYREKVGEDVPSIQEILSNASLLLSNGHFSVHYHKPLLPDIIEVGGLSRKSKVAKPLSNELEDFIGKGKHGFIYFSMGTLIKSDTMPEDKRKLFINVFKKLKQQVLWKWDSESMPDLPENVKLSKWLPQEDVLGHKDIKMFITHCGGGGTEEAIYHGVPMIGMPMFGDQLLNSKVALSHGILIEIDWNQLTEEMLLEKIEEMLNDQKYTNNVKKLSSIYKDQPQDPMTRAVYWVEYVMRHKGAHHLRSVGRKLYWFQYHSYDVMLAYLGIFGLIIYISYASLRWIARKTCCRSRKSEKSKRE